ncbi:alanine racemase [Bordetella genomosp. 5]|uniref:Alanine racemase n=2 Tax=Bordetella genomosp. 5 TaxID=1395608 RepID=A0A261TAI5_9BORD|nr:alanine racemase [Bordetella genomosp. 5]
MSGVMPAQPRVVARVDAGAVAHNLATLRGWLGAPQGRAPRIWATVKADAYGHGLAHVLPGLAQADGLAALNLAEAQACRAAGWRGPVLVYGGLHEPADAERLTQDDLHLVISHAAQLDWLRDAATAPARPPALWLRYSGDLNLSGFDTAEYRDAYERAQALVRRGRVRAVHHLNHYAAAEDDDGVAQADAAFRAAIAGLPGCVSTSNSAALARHQAHAGTTDWVRPGLALYGASPLAGATGAELGLRPAMSLHSRLIATRRVAAGTHLGYRGAYVSERDMLVGMVSCGYADGYPRLAQTGTPVLVDGVPTRVVGRISMDMMAVDLDPAPHARPGADVLLWGPALPVETVAAAAGTIAADLLTGLTGRVPVQAAAAQAATSSREREGANSRNSAVATR